MKEDNDAVLLDVRGLAAPEPLEHILEALGALPANGKLRVLIDREPFPLYDILAGSFQHRIRNTDDYRYELLIWRQP